MQVTACHNLPLSRKVLTFHIPIFVIVFMPKVVDLESVRLPLVGVSLIPRFNVCRLLAHSTQLDDGAAT